MSVKYRKWHLGGGPVTLKPLNQFIKLSTGIKICLLLNWAGKKRIERLAAQLALKQNLVAEAFNYFKQAVNRHMTQGRNSEHFAAACLYLACRLSANSEQGMSL